MLYKITLWNGRCGLTPARSPQHAARLALEEEGSNNVRRVEKATKDDIAWISGMGGAIPSDPFRKTANA
jgi:hypothetical protein